MIKSYAILKKASADLCALEAAPVAISERDYLTAVFWNGEGCACAKVIYRRRPAFRVVLCSSGNVQELGRIAKCVAIQDVNERIDCLEGRGNIPDPTREFDSTEAPQWGPSYDCRMQRPLH